MKFLCLVVLSLVSSIKIYSQEIENYDSIPKNQIDSNYAHNFGFSIGGALSMPVINPIAMDTFSNWQAKPSIMISLGMLYNKTINEQFSIQSGLILNFSKIPISYTLNHLNQEKITNYSSLAIPFLASYKFDKKKDGLFISFGAQAELDISKSIDKDNRIFPLKTFVPDIYTAIGYRLNNYISIYEIRFFYQIIPINILKPDGELYSKALSSIIIWRTGILFTIR